jgi:glucose/mannose-6-phosphate isomerase
MFRMFSNLLLGDWTSYYLAITNKTDPTPVVLVEEFKSLIVK